MSIDYSASLSAQAPAVGDCFNRRCPSRVVLGHVTGRWGSLVLSALRENEVLRFSELRHRIGGISEKMLAQTLRDLERDGLLSRKSRPVVPPYVDYRLTELGAGAAERVEALVRWVEGHVGTVVGAQSAFDALDKRPARGPTLR